MDKPVSSTATELKIGDWISVKRMGNSRMTLAGEVLELTEDKVRVKFMDLKHTWNKESRRWISNFYIRTLKRASIRILGISPKKEQEHDQSSGQAEDTRATED